MRTNADARIRLYDALVAIGGRVRARFRREQDAAGRALRVRETIALDPRRRLHLVQCGDGQVVLLTGGTQDIVVGWIAPP